MRLPLRRPRPGRGQALVEVALLLPLVLVFALMIILFWLHFSRTSAYAQTATTLAEWIGRSGEYEPGVMCPAVAGIMAGTLGVESDPGCYTGDANVYLYVFVTPPGCADPCGTAFSAGTPAPTEPQNPPVIPSDTGWDTALCRDGASGGSCWATIPNGARVSVDIWGYQRIASLGDGGAGFYMTPAGHGVSIVTGEAPVSP